MRKRRLWAVLLSAGMAASMLGGCASRAVVTEDMIPTVTDLRAETSQEAQEAQEANMFELSMNKSYMAELTRLDGDNTETASVDAKEIKVVLKATSMAKDLKIKIVNEKTDKVITGTLFEVSVTDSNKKTKNYKDEDKDGIIYIKEMAPGKCNVSLKTSGSYAAPKDITAEVKANLEYKTVDITDEIKKESEINVAQEDSNTSGNADAGTSPVLTDTVEYVASTKTEIVEEVTTQKQKVDSFGQPMYASLKKDAWGQDMYEDPEIPAHADGDNDGKCDRCGNGMQVQKPPEEEDPVTPEPASPSEPKPEETETQPVGTAGVSLHKLQLVATAPADGDPGCKPIYDTSKKPIYDTSSAKVMEDVVTKKVTGYKYTGWQTIDGATYYYDKNGKAVTGSQVIQGIQYTFSSTGVRSGTIGIDVSKYQSTINWSKVKNAGINFAIIRCGYRGYGSGVLVQDPMFASHITGARKAGLRVGVYFFSQAVNEAEAVEEASMAVSLARQYGINMPIAIDSEYAAGGRGRADNLSKAARTQVTVAFCNTVANAGYTPMVYASKAWFSDHLNVSQFPGSYRIWVAHYAAKCGYGGRYDIWQNSSKGRVDGVSGNVDMNISSI